MNPHSNLQSVNIYIYGLDHQLSMLVLLFVFFWLLTDLNVGLL